MYRNIIKPGVSSSTTRNPKTIAEDISNDIRVLRPEATPLLTLSQYLPKGKAPISHKVQTVQYYSFSHKDYSPTCIAGSTIGKQWTRFGRIKLNQPSRPDVQDVMFYQPQDKLFIGATGQTVEIVMTPTSNMSMSTDNTSRFVADPAFTGNTSTTCEPGFVIVRPIKAEPFKAFSSSDIIFLGRTIYEGQRIEAMPNNRDIVYDCNFVEHKEATIEMTEDQKEWVKSSLTKPDWDWQQQEMMEEFKRSIEENLMWSDRSVDMTVPGRPKRHMMGLFHAIKSNVSVYNPFAVTNFENLLSNFCFDQAFSYNPNGTKKIAICGARFLYNFNQQFNQFRRIDGLNPSDKKVGLDLDTYVLPGGFELKLIRSDQMLPRNTPMEHWCFVIDPKEMDLRIVKNFNTRLYANNDERLAKLAVEWQGTISWHREESMALLRTQD